MENTGNMMFGDDLPQWYVAVGENWVGPLTSSDVYDRILKGEMSWAHYVWKSGFTGWKRVCDVEVFMPAVPGAPPPGVLDDVKDSVRPGIKKSKRPSAPEEPRSSKEKREWFLHYNSSQFGPFGLSEVKRFLTIGKIHGRVHAWKEGMGTWERLERLELFKKECKVAEAAYEDRRTKREEGGYHPELGGGGPEPTAFVQAPGSDQRRAPRRPIVARILMAQGSNVITGVCRDVSVGGMQVLTDHLPGPAGTRIKLNVSPSEAGAGIEPFVAEGVVVRILEDGRGFSFRFEKLPPAARDAIEKYFRTDYDPS